MSLTRELEHQGEWLFKRRSYVPLIFAVPFLAAFYGYRWPFESYFTYAVWSRVCLGISISGLAIRCLVIGFAPAQTSGRNTARQIASQLNTTGAYALVRHPLYLGNFLIGLGVCLAPGVWWLPCLYCLLFWAYYERIMYAEEAFLRRMFGREFEDWAAKTPAFFPRSLKWKRPTLPFSFRNILRREYTGLMVVILGNAAVQFTEHLIIDHCIVYEAFWVTLLIGGSTTYFLLRSLKAYTTILDVPGR